MRSRGGGTCSAGGGLGFLNTCALGFSGVIFGLIVVDNAVSGAELRSVFGLFTVPAKLYPWALLGLWQLLVPGVSFLVRPIFAMCSVVCTLLVGCNSAASHLVSRTLPSPHHLPPDHTLRT